MDENREWALEQIKSDETDRIADALLSLAFYNEDWMFVENLCIEYSSHSDSKVRGIAILCFGHLARIHGQLHNEKVMPIINKALMDKDDFIRGHAHDAKDDINTFLKN